MPRETAAQMRTRVSLLLADFDNRNRELRKLDKIVAGLKEQIKEIPDGKYLDWEVTRAAPREITDSVAVKRGYAERGELMPTRLTEPAVVVKPVVK